MAMSKNKLQFKFKPSAAASQETTASNDNGVAA